MRNHLSAAIGKTGARTRAEAVRIAERPTAGCWGTEGRMDQAQLGDVQRTLFIPLAARAQETGKEHPVLRDPKAVAMLAALDFDPAKYGKGTGGGIVVLRTAIFDYGSAPSWPGTRPDRGGARHRAEHAVRAGGQRPGALDRPGPAGHDRAAPQVLHGH